MTLDETDLSIVKLLRQDPRTSITQIADTIGISRLTAKKRLDRMLDNKLLSLSANVNLNKQGVKIALLGLEVKSIEEWDECLNKLSTLPWVIMGFKSMSKSNLRVLIYGETDEILEKNIDEFRYYHCVNFIDAVILGKTLVGDLQRIIQLQNNT